MDRIHGSKTGRSDAARVRAAQERARALLSDEALQRVLARPAAFELPTARQIFVNRNLALAKIELVGFDMDYTLAIYHLRRIEELSFAMTVDKLVAAFGYPEALRQLRYDHGFVIRGLFVDKVRGNLLKIDRFGHVGRAYHGREPLSDEALQRLYRNERIRLKSPEYAWIDTLFALPEASLFAGAVDLLEREQARPPDYTKLYDDIREAIDTVHRDNSLKAVLRQDLGRFIYRDPELAPALHKLRSGGKRLFVLTNSLWDYTDAVMSFLLDDRLPEYPSWRNYFDYIITNARKPGFFSEGHPFEELDADSDSNTVLGEADALERGRVYQGGNLAAFERLTGTAGERVLYVGDHIYGDILKSKKSSMWRTCMVVQEIEDELTYLESRRADIERLAELEQLRARLVDGVSDRRTHLNQLERRLARLETADPSRDALRDEFDRVKVELDQTRRALREVDELAGTLEGDVERGFNEYWGLQFKEGPESSRFGEQVEQYACTYTSRVSNFGLYSPAHYFRAARAFMPHELAGGLSGKLATSGSEGLPKATNRAPTEIP